MYIMAKEQSSESYKRTLVDNVLKADRGTEFTNELIRKICVLLKIKQSFSKPYRHETLVTVEGNHRALNEYFQNFVEDNNWHKWIPYSAFAFNTAPNVDTNYTFELVYENLSRLSDDELKNLEKIYNIDNYLNELKIRLSHSLQKSRDIVLEVKKKRILESGRRQNRIEPNIGDQDLVKAKNSNILL